MAELTLIAVLLGLAFSLVPTARWALSEPRSSARELGGYILLASLGAAYLLITGISPLAPDGSGIFAFVGGGALGTLIIDGASAVSTALPGKK